MLDNNQLEGTIPESLYKLRSLRQLSLDNNHIEGELSYSLGNLTNLECSR